MQVDPLDDIDVINLELALADLSQIEKRMDRLKKGAQQDITGWQPVRWQHRLHIDIGLIFACSHLNCMHLQLLEAPTVLLAGGNTLQQRAI